MYTSGKDWEYQPSKKLLDQLSETLPSHYEAWTLGKADKQEHPIYLLWAGPGTGKSRGLEEFQTLCVKSVPDAFLKQRLRDAFVFKVL